MTATELTLFEKSWWSARSVAWTHQAAGPI